MVCTPDNRTECVKGTYKYPTQCVGPVQPPGSTLQPLHSLASQEAKVPQVPQARLQTPPPLQAPAGAFPALWQHQQPRSFRDKCRATAAASAAGTTLLQV